MTDLAQARPGLLVLIDPGRTDAAQAGALARAAQSAGADGVLVGGSFDGSSETHRVAVAVRESAPGLPLVLFPGSAMQLTDAVDLILFLSLV